MGKLYFYPTFVLMFKRSILLFSFSIALSLQALPVKDSLFSLIVGFSRPVQDYSLQTLTGNAFSQIEALDINRTYFKFTYSSRRLNHSSAYKLLSALPNFLQIQENSQVYLRATTPNDTLFGKQFHLQLIHAVEAWDITRSGVNRRGDTIVIAVVDDGLHINHPDFKGNIWINYADTMGNGLDDDGNGFIDDTYGWNFIGRNNDISDSFYYKAGHGSPVAGIIGAKTNNITGVSGIMWNVKLMIVNVTDTSPNMAIYQSDVIKAYSYVLHQRQLYNQTNGQKGAFVVAINSSWGIDGKKPNQAPLWCAFYDTLGKAGILSVCAVSNAQEQLDTYGDLPTLCTSEHLIAVGNSTRFDNYAGGGYSDISVDLFAPGSNIFTTAAYTKTNILSNRIFRDGYSGSSFSAPMVTAALGVMHSYACERLLDTIKNNPLKANLILRKLLLDGVDQVNALDGKCVTGGRLNIQKALKIMDMYCQGEVGVTSTAWTNGLLVYPNPAQDIINIQCDSEIIFVECLDVQGRLIELSFNEGQLDISGLLPGIYFLRIRVEEGETTVKIVKS